MRLTMDQMAERYDQDVLRAIIKLSEATKKAKDPVTQTMCKRFRAWLQKHTNGRPVLSKKWLQDPAEALAELRTSADIMGVTAENVSEWRIHRKNIAKPYSSNNFMFVREQPK